MNIESILSKIEDECYKGIEQHGEFNSLHEGWAVLYEEVDELWEEVRKKKAFRSAENIKTECIQIAAMALKIVVSLEDIKYK